MGGSVPLLAKTKQLAAAAEALTQPEEIQDFCLRTADCGSGSGRDFGLSPAQRL
jgi:hypothetical protein